MSAPQDKSIVARIGRPDDTLRFAQSADTIRALFGPLLSNPGELHPSRAVARKAGAANGLALEKRLFAEHVLRTEDLERRRIARELHDSTVQDLIAIKLAFKRLPHLDGDVLAQTVFADIKLALSQALKDLRTLSYLLHPPVIGETGLQGALSTLVLGLSNRMDMRMVFNNDCPAIRFARDVELAFYRIAQEALTNVHRHAAADTTIVRLCRRGGSMVLEIEDDGVGIPAGEQTMDMGVGIQSMRSRVRQFGGKLQIVRLQPGTLVRASIPTDILLS